MAKQKNTDSTSVASLMEKAEKDPQFFHDLIWNTEEILPSLEFLSRKEKAAILAMEPEELLQQLTASRVPIIVSADGGDTCTGFTCGATCVGSCDVSCVGTCAITGDMQMGDRTTLPAENPPYQDFVVNFQRNFRQFQR